MIRLPQHPYDIAVFSQILASKQFRVAVYGNRHSIPAEYAGASLTLKRYPDRLCSYHRENSLFAMCEATTGERILNCPIIPRRF